MNKKKICASFMMVLVISLPLWGTSVLADDPGFYPSSEDESTEGAYNDVRWFASGFYKLDTDVGTPTQLNYVYDDVINGDSSYFVCDSTGCPPVVGPGAAHCQTQLNLAHSGTLTHTVSGSLVHDCSNPACPADHDVSGINIDDHDASVDIANHTDTITPNLDCVKFTVSRDAVVTKWNVTGHVHIPGI